MSQASEWALLYKQVTAARPEQHIAPKTDNHERQVFAAVTEEGKVRIAVGTGVGILDPDIFLELCRWGLATFGEEP